MTSPTPYAHLERLSDDIGIFEHAEGSIPRRHHGYCVDDVARALVVVTREPDPSPVLRDLASRYLAFLASAQAPDGRCHNRLGIDRRWEDRPSVEDCWGRALWGLGTAAVRSSDPVLQRIAAERFALSARGRSPYPRAMAFAALGAAEILDGTPDDPTALALLAAVPTAIGRPAPDAAWPWPEPRLAYANAVLPEALIAAGEHLGAEQVLDDGLGLLAWLLDIETSDDHLSVTPAGGWGLGEARPGFDQQPIEVAALADACVRALRITGDRRWLTGLEHATGWFLGENDGGYPLHDPVTGGGYDGLHRDGRNDNQGAESTLALISTLQHANRLVRP